MSFKNISIILIVAIGIYSYFKYGEQSSEQLVSNIHITSDREGHNLEFDFSNSVRYLGHFPNEVSNIVQVKLRAIGFSEFRENVSLLDQFVQPADIKEKFLQDVRYEGDVPGGPFLVVRFAKPMKFNVTESNGLKGLIISYNRE